MRYLSSIVLEWFYRTIKVSFLKKRRLFLEKSLRLESLFWSCFKIELDKFR